MFKALLHLSRSLASSFVLSASATASPSSCFPTFPAVSSAARSWNIDGARPFSLISYPVASNCSLPAGTTAAGSSSSSDRMAPWCHPQSRTVFGAPSKKLNQQIHTHDKYKVVHAQPTYE